MPSLRVLGALQTPHTYLKMNKPSVTLTNILLGVIAAEVVVLTVQAFAERQASAAADGGGSLGSAPQHKPQPHTAYFPLREALHQAALFFRRLFGQGGDFVESQDMAPSAYRARPHAGMAADEDGDGPHFKGSLQGITEKMKDPAWAGLLAANDGNIALTDANRAVPMPNSGQFVERLDKNPYVGKGMKDHSRDKF